MESPARYLCLKIPVTVIIGTKILVWESSQNSWGSLSRDAPFITAGKQMKNK